MMVAEREWISQVPENTKVGIEFFLEFTDLYFMCQ